MAAEVTLINRSTEQVYLADGTLLDIVTWIDEEGRTGADPVDAVACVCGSNALGWWALDLTDFEAIVRN